ncbi:MAG TPA: four helix bundle protein [Cyclobacteriaceae bacterium]|nr:four helix bundle protein [Cyclobacteriaceae bacterium]
MEYVENFKELEVYKMTRELSGEIFELTKGFPREEMYSLTDQIRRSSRSIGAQIAEAWAKRKYEKHFISKLTDADAEQQETQHWIETALHCAYLTNEKASELLSKCASIGKMLNSMMKKSHLFCVKEEDIAYNRLPKTDY